MMLLAGAAGFACIVAFVGFWFGLNPPEPEPSRVPVKWDRSGGADDDLNNTGTLIAGAAQPSQHPGSWPGFRGADGSNVSVNQRKPRPFPESGPTELWRIELGEGHAGAAIHEGRVYLIDYDRPKKEDAIRCLSLDDGGEIWRYTYSVNVKRNHGMSRTAPAVAGGFVVTLGPKCHVHCLDAKTGKLAWSKDLVKECGTVTPPWYAGQCPLIDGDRVILAPGAKPLMMAVELATGKTVWETQEEADLGMTHASIAALTFQDRRLYVYQAWQYAVCVDAETGKVLWTHPLWGKNRPLAEIATPLPVGDGRVFFTTGYGAGSVMLRLTVEGSGIGVEEVFRLNATVFGSDQQTPMLYRGHIFGVVPSGEMACLSLDGKRVWDSGKERRFGLGPYLIADGHLLILNDQDCTLHLARADTKSYKELAVAKVLDGHDAWGPMAIAEGRLILRDLTQMVCLDLCGTKSAKAPK